ncbi:MAG TPA: DinB family protein [Bryobacteraceae bacterium]|nr:DinB family protein [Bryobacteraceae bacterium]
MSEIAELLERFRRGPELIASALTGAAGSEVDFKPAPNKWSVRQIAAHVSDSELVAAERMRRIIAEDKPQIVGYDQNKWAENLDYARRKPSQSLEMFRDIRAESYELLKGVPEAAYQRTGQHSERGPMTLLNLIELMAQHAEKHAQQIREVRAAFKQAKAAGQA